MANKRDNIAAHYDERVSSEVPSHEVLDWGSAEEQRRRFHVLFEILRDETAVPGGTETPLTVLDVGCGLGDLHDYLDKDFSLLVKRATP